jgi:hypothetical protein
MTYTLTLTKRELVQLSSLCADHLDDEHFVHASGVTYSPSALRYVAELEALVAKLSALVETTA